MVLEGSEEFFDETYISTTMGGNSSNEVLSFKAKLYERGLKNIGFYFRTFKRQEDRLNNTFKDKLDINLITIFHKMVSYERRQNEIMHCH